MSRRSRGRSGGEDEPALFDLPLAAPEQPRRKREEKREDRPREQARPAEADERPEPEGPGAPRALPLFDETGGEDFGERPAEPGRVAEPVPVPQRVAERPAVAPGPPPVTLAARYLAGLADLAVHAALAVSLLFGARLLGTAAGFGDWPALAVFLLVFSFLYTLLPLAFWGRTPGMAWARLVARAPGDVSLTFGQSARRWLAGLLTLVLLGLPTLLAAGGGRSLADRLSGSRLQVG